jgi:ABC-type dipeptide/oligopeptide/nickel transport system permease subunit
MLDGWWLAFFPGLAITTLVISLALIGDGIQETGTASA